MEHKQLIKILIYKNVLFLNYLNLILNKKNFQKNSKSIN